MEGDSSFVTGAGSVAIGGSATSTDLRSVVIGRGATAISNADTTVAIGDGATINSGNYSIAVGNAVTANGSGRVAISDGDPVGLAESLAASCVFSTDAFRVFEGLTTHAVTYGPVFHDYSSLMVLENFSEKGENPLHPYQLHPNAQLYMPKIRNANKSPAFSVVSDINDSTNYAGMATIGAGAALAGAGLGVVVAGGVGAGFVMAGGLTIGLAVLDVAYCSLAAAVFGATSISLIAFPPLLVVAGALVVIAGAVLTTVVITALVSAAIIHWATSLWLQNNAADWKFQLPAYWTHYACQMGIETVADMTDVAWTFEVINKAGQYGKLIFKVEDDAYANGYAYVEQRDGGRVQSWTNDTGEKQTIGVSFVPNATFHWTVRYTVLTGAEGG